MISSKSILFGINEVGVIRYHFLIWSAGVKGLTFPKHEVSISISEIGHSVSFGNNQFHPKVFVIKLTGVASEGNFHDILEILTLEVSLFGISSLVIYPLANISERNFFTLSAWILPQYAFEFIGLASAFPAHIRSTLLGVYAANQPSLGLEPLSVFTFEVQVFKA